MAQGNAVVLPAHEDASDQKKDPSASTDGSIFKPMKHRVDVKTGRFVRLTQEDRSQYLLFSIKIA